MAATAWAVNSQAMPSGPAVGWKTMLKPENVVLPADTDRGNVSSTYWMGRRQSIWSR
jgi:hypothetical protein